MGLFDSYKRAAEYEGVAPFSQSQAPDFSAVKSRQPLDLNEGGFAPYGADTFDGPSKGSGGFSPEPMDFDFNAPAKSNAAYQEEDTAPVQEMPIKPAQMATPPELKAQPESAEPEQPRISRDQLLKMAGMETDEAKAQRLSKASTDAQTVNIGGRTFANPAQPGISDLEAARRYQAVAGAKEAQGTPFADFARREMQAMRQDPNRMGVVKQAVQGERQAAAAEAQAAKDAEDKRRFELDFGIKQAAEKRAAEAQPLDIEAKKAAIRKANVEAGVAEKTQDTQIKKAQADLDNIYNDNADKKSQIALRERVQKFNEKNKDDEDARNWVNSTYENFNKVKQTFQDRLDKAQEVFDKEPLRFKAIFGDKDIADIRAEINADMANAWNHTAHSARQSAKYSNISEPDEVIPSTPPKLSNPVARGTADKALGAAQKVAQTVGAVKGGFIPSL